MNGNMTFIRFSPNFLTHWNKHHFCFEVVAIVRATPNRIKFQLQIFTN
jgi:hypothetical protein